MNHITILPTAIDAASNRCRGIWAETRQRRSSTEDEGLWSWLRRMTQEALEKGERLDSGKIRYRGIKFVIEQTVTMNLEPEYETAFILKSVERVRS